MYADAGESRVANNKGSLSSKRGSAVKRALAALTLAAGLIFAGAQAMPTTTQASAGCKMVCTEFIDPNSGQCYIQCCPEDPECMMPCEMKPCSSPTTSEQK